MDGVRRGRVLNKTKIGLLHKVKKGTGFPLIRWSLDNVASLHQIMLAGLLHSGLAAIDDHGG